MGELTKEYFDQQLGQLVSKKDLGTVLDKRFDKMAAMIKSGFDHTATIQDVKILNQKIDKVGDRLQTVETKLDRALYTETVHLETRIKRLEEHVGIKPAHT